jgi:choline dehydrogenase-like flavoprotein
MKTNPSTGTYDVIVVGSGAGGSAVTHRLVQSGLRVLLVEKGRSLPKSGATLRVDSVIGEGAFKSKEVWSDGTGRPFVPEEYFNLGGKTKWYGAALLRFGPQEFEPDPAHQCFGWPCTFDEMRPYYEQIEQLLSPREFPIEPGLSSIVQGLRNRTDAWRAEPLPLGLKQQILAHREEATHFDGFASPQGLKSDGECSLLEQVAGAANLTISTGIAVADLLGQAGNPERIVGVRLENGAVFQARHVVLAAGAMHSPRLLQQYMAQRHGRERFPVADAVGRYFKLHLLTAVLAISPARKADLIRKTTLLLNEGLPHSSVQPLGFDGELIATLIPRFVPRPVARIIGSRAYGFFLQTEDGSSPDNRVLGAGGADSRPVLDYDPSRTPAPLEEHRSLVETFCRDLRRAGYITLSQAIGLHGTAHACGTMRAGTDPRDSVVDATGRVHGFRGISVGDGSVLPRSSRVNPALTIYAWGLRLADRIAADHNTGAGTTTSEGTPRAVGSEAAFG